MMLLGTPVMAGPDEQNKKQNGTEATAQDAAPGSADREVEPGGSGYQGKSNSNPDGEGVDKPYAAAGQDAETQGESDYDGNNGCGNDTDFADDNNGNCGKPDKDRGPDDGGEGGGEVAATGGENKTTGNALATTGEVTSGQTAGETASSAQVLGIQIERSAAPAASAAVATNAAPAEGAAAGGAAVLGAQVERGAVALARTGFPLALLALAGAALVGGGAAMRRFSRK